MCKKPQIGFTKLLLVSDVEGWARSEVVVRSFQDLISHFTFVGSKEAKSIKRKSHKSKIMNSNTMFLLQDESQKVQFPWKLHILLEEAEMKGHDKVVSWLPNGLGFKVHDKDAFAEEVMPHYFSSNKFKTFQRNLNLWGFQTLTRDPDRGAAFHPYFIRGKPEECSQMERIRVKKGLKRPKVVLSSNGQLAPPSAPPSPLIGAMSSSPSLQPSNALPKMISPDMTPTMTPTPMVSSKVMAPNLGNNSSNNNNALLLNIRAIQDYFALECLRAGALRSSLNQTGNAYQSIDSISSQVQSIMAGGTTFTPRSQSN